MASVTLTDFILRSRERADMENSRFISDAELTRYINASISELYDLLIASRGENYYITSTTFSTSGGVDSYSLPAGMLKVMGVDLVRGTNEAYTLKSFKWQERNQSREPYFFNDSLNLRYQIRANEIVFSPVPKGGQTIKLWYVPAFQNLSGGSDSFDGINGWEEYVIIDSAIKMKSKEESPVDELLLAKQEMKARILQASSGRDSTEPARVVDTQGIGRSQWW
jgi:hypothetical protein